MKLELGNFHVKEIRFADKTEYKDGILSVNKNEALAVVRQDEHITDAELHIANPGESVRLCPVKDAIEPRSRISGNPVFPGVTGELMQAGNGRTHCLKNMCVTVVGKHYGGFQDGIIDMSGEGTKRTYYSTIINLVLVADSDEALEQKEQQKRNHALRTAGMRLSEYLGAAVKELVPEKIETYESGALLERSDKESRLPAVALVMQTQSQMEEAGYNTLVYGWDANRMLPTLMHPCEILDGAVISGSFMPSSSKWSTYDFQNFPMIRRLYAEHGKTINFAGIILSNLNVALEQKERAALFVAQIAKNIGVKAAVVAEEGYGNPDADFIACIVALEDAGIKTVGLTNESTGRDGASQPLMTLDKKADAIVSCGNVSSLVELPAMKTVIGELAALARDGNSGGWADDEILGSSVREDGSIIMENNGMFCGDQVVGWSVKSMAEY